MARIDLNCDLGEGAACDAALMPLVTSANIACGGHAGDRETMRATVALARAQGVGVGAHPGFADRANFGRRELALGPREIERLVTEQVAALGEFGAVRHVKPHGALYNLAARERTVAEAIAAAVSAVDPALILFGLAGSALLAAGRTRGLRVVGEFFADRTYRADGSLTPRNVVGALIEDEEAMVAQVLRLVRDGVVRATNGVDVRIEAETVCLHGDGPRAVSFARRLRAELQSAGVEVRPVCVLIDDNRRG